MGVYCGCSFAIALILALANINQTLWIGQHDTELGGLLQPWSYREQGLRVLGGDAEDAAEQTEDGGA